MSIFGRHPKQVDPHQQIVEEAYKTLHKYLAGESGVTTEQADIAARLVTNHEHALAAVRMARLRG